MNDIAPALEPAASLGAKINGKPVTFKPHETILQCARRHDFHIPTLCELDDIDHTPGTCRVCLVEARMPGQDRSMILTSCNTPMQEGMEVQTRTAKVREHAAAAGRTADGGPRLSNAPPASVTAIANCRTSRNSSACTKAGSPTRRSLPNGPSTGRRRP